MTTLSGLLLALVAAAAPAPRGMVLDFGTKWCGPCQSVAPLVARLERDGLPIRSVDAELQRDLAQQFGITNYPTFVLVIDGKEVDRHVGTMDEASLRAWLERIPQTEPATQVAQPGTGRSTQPFVADPNVRLGASTALGLEFDEASAPFQPRPAPQRSQPEGAATAGTDQRGPAEFPTAEIRASNVSLNDDAAEPSGAAAPMAASVRLRVTIDGRINLGSGTIIHSDDRQALIATCGHIFRGFAEGSPIEVNLFEGQESRSLAGKLVKFDLESDVGLLSIDTDRTLPVAPVARDVQKAQAQEAVVSIGCSGGQPPTVEELVVTEVNPYIGPDNLECTGVPVQGRSGGGLFRTSGELVAICIAADPKRKRGVYAGLLALHELLESAGYAHLYRTPDTVVAGAAPAGASATSTPDGGAASDAGRSLLDSLAPAGEAEGQTLPARQDSPLLAFEPGSRDAAAPAASGTPVQLGPEASDAEIVCIIRSRTQPESNSRVVIIHQASPKLLSYLRGEMGTSVSGEGAAALLSNHPARRTREESVPTMGVGRTPAAVSAEFPRPGQTTLSQKPTLQPTVLTATVTPRRYVRSR